MKELGDLRERLRRLRGQTEPQPVDPTPAGAEPHPESGAKAPPAGAERRPPVALPPGDTVERAEGLAHVIDASLDTGRLGRAPLVHACPPVPLQRWAGADAALELAPDEVLYLDTETTGLAGGTGTFVFLAGLGRFAASGFAVRQLFLIGPQHERAHLAAIAEAAHGARAVVTYNGGSFDLPQLRTRYLLHGLPDPFASLLHLDLLPVARRLWAEALPDCRLGTVEAALFGARRSHDDVPGRLVPERYAAYLRFGDTDGLAGVLEHNRVDVAALAALQAYVAHLFDGRREASVAEELALARLCEDAGASEAALERYARCQEGQIEARWRASLLHKRAGRLGRAAALWRELETLGHVDACLELAKLFEHRLRAPGRALGYVARARELTPAAASRAHEELDRREHRLRRKRARGGEVGR